MNQLFYGIKGHLHGFFGCVTSAVLSVQSVLNRKSGTAFGGDGLN